MQVNPYLALGEICKRSFYRFVKEFWDVIIPEIPVWNWHMKYLCDELQYLNSFVVKRQPKPHDLVVNISPGTTKTTVCIIMYSAWVWAIDPTQRLLISTHSLGLTLANSLKIRDIIVSDKYKKCFPNVELRADQSVKSNFLNTLGGQIYSSSVDSSPIGQHYHQILMDDLLNTKEATSKIERENAIYHVTQTLSRRKIDQKITPMILVMQRLHKNDPSGYLLEHKKNIKHINLPAEDKGNVKPKELAANYIDGLFDPIRLGPEVLKESKEDLGTHGYNSQMLQQPEALDGGIFKQEWFEIIDWQPEYAALKWNFVIDTAYTKNEMNDPSGFMVFAEYKNQYIIRKFESEFLEFPDLIKKTISFANLNGYTRRSIIEVEPKASGKSLVQIMRRETSLNIRESKNPTKDKVARANDVSPICESGRVKLIRGSWNKGFLEEVCAFPNAEHDEAVDDLVMMLIKTFKKKQKSIRKVN